MEARTRQIAVLLLSAAALAGCPRFHYCVQGETAAPAAPGEQPRPDLPPPELKVALFGDQGHGRDAARVLRMVRGERPQLVVHLGDFDYAGGPMRWDRQLSSCGIEEDVPFVAVPGNHDMAEWDRYLQVLERRLVGTPGLRCSGALGTDYRCSFHGLSLVLSSVGTTGDGHVPMIRSNLAASDSIWKICAWHKNQTDLQTGSKGDEVGWGAYRACAAAGAIIVNGHEHAYSRTRTLTDLGNRPAGHGATGPPDRLQVGPGRTFVVVSGLGGRSRRSFKGDLDEQSWWATVYTDDVYIDNGRQVTGHRQDYGALFLVFNVDGDPRRGRGYFKTAAGQILDRFEIHAVDRARRAAARRWGGPRRTSAR